MIRIHNGPLKEEPSHSWGGGGKCSSQNRLKKVESARRREPVPTGTTSLMQAEKRVEGQDVLGNGT